MIVDDYDINGINQVTHRNISLSRIAYGRGQVPIDTVASSFGLSVFDYNQAVQDTIVYCIDTGTSFQSLRARLIIKFVCQGWAGGKLWETSYSVDIPSQHFSGIGHL